MFLRASKQKLPIRNFHLSASHKTLSFLQSTLKSNARGSNGSLTLVSGPYASLQKSSVRCFSSSQDRPFFTDFFSMLEKTEQEAESKLAQQQQEEQDRAQKSKKQFKQQTKEKKWVGQAQKQAISEQAHFNFIKAEHENVRQDRNYQRLISDCYQAVKFLEVLPLNVLEESIRIFRVNLWNQYERRKVPRLLEEMLEKEKDSELSQKQQQEMQEEEEGKGQGEDVWVENLNWQKQEPVLGRLERELGSMKEVAEDVYYSLQVVLEFMDKGLKGLLTGDLSVFLVQQIKTSIEKFMTRFDEISLELQNLMEKDKTLEAFINEHFQVPSVQESETHNAPSYEQIQNMESFITVMQKQDWKKHIQVGHTQNYTTSFEGIDESMLSAPSQQQMVFNDRRNMNEYLRKQAGKIKKVNKSQVESLKTEINEIINQLYNEVLGKALDLDKYHIPIHGIRFPQNENPMNLFQRQLKIEELSFDLSHQKYKATLESMIQIGKADQMAISHKYILNWMKGLEAQVVEQQKIYLKRGSMDPQKSKVGYYLIQLPSEKIASICVLHLMKTLFSSFIKDMKDQADQANYIPEDKDFSETDIKITAISLFSEVGKLFDKELKASANSSSQRNSGKVKKDLTNQKIAQHLYNNDQAFTSVPRDVQLKLGAFLTNLMCKNLKYDVGRKSYLLLKPQIVRTEREKFVGYIIFNKSFLENFIGELDKIHDLNLQLERSLPMIYPPAPWKNYHFGGYYLRQTKMAKILPNFREALKYFHKTDLTEMCNVLDVLGQVKWRLNRKVLEMIEYSWSVGGGMGEVPLRFNKQEISPEIIRAANFKEKLKLLKQYQLNKETHALRCEFLLRLQIAQSFKNVDSLYFPHNIDFRGRVYPIPPHLNHMGPDINRGILEFSEGKPLGKNGLFWLKVHLANKIGKDKLALADRAFYADSIMEVVHRIADDPKNNLEWLESDNPWQTLACMFELSAAMRSPNPEEYISHAHVHVDGSFNGMQHYSALGRDKRGGKNVNLMDGEQPGDVYTGILELVLNEIENETDEKWIEVAKSLKGNVNRKVIKQTVMTSVYGVTFIGARAQIQRQLKDKRVFETNGELYNASKYLAKVTIKCIGDMFKDVNNIKDWFAKCAKVVAHTGDAVKWVTPMGLPCVQPYKYITPKNVIKTVLQSVSLANSLDDQPVNKSKQNSAFPPNYIHSLDSTHMMLTSLQCQQEYLFAINLCRGIVYAAVHDSYWCHAKDIERMGQILRDQFVSLHSRPLIQRLEENFKSRYPNEKFPEVPEAGELDLEEIKNSTYFFA